MNALRGHRWSGNVRELRNVVESALAMGSINLNGLAQPAPPAPNAAMIPQYRLARAEALAAFERSYLRRLIETTGGNASAAARAANMDRPVAAAPSRLALKVFQPTGNCRRALRHDSCSRYGHVRDRPTSVRAKPAAPRRQDDSHSEDQRRCRRSTFR
jgi:hypothetical protein